MKLIVILIFVFSMIFVSVFGDNPPNDKQKANPFLFNATAINESLKGLNDLESAVKINDSVKINSILEASESKIARAVFPKNIDKSAAPGKIPSFLWTFVLSAVGTYTIYGTVLGPVSVLVVYFSSHRDKKEVRLSIWGWITGTLLGAGLWLFVRSLKV